MTLAQSSTIESPHDPLVGTWKLNGAKSTGKVKDATFVTDVDGNNHRTSVQATLADGTRVSYTLDYPAAGGKGIVSGIDAYDAVVLTRSGANTSTMTYMKGGKAVRTIDSLVSQDGKSATLTVTGADVRGNVITTPETYLYNKQ